jgi:hypothetical protein
MFVFPARCWTSVELARSPAGLICGVSGKRVGKQFRDLFLLLVDEMWKIRESLGWIDLLSSQLFHTGVRTRHKLWYNIIRKTI